MGSPELEQAKRQIAEAERAFLLGEGSAQTLLGAMREALHLAVGSKLLPWVQTVNGSWVREPEIGASVCMVCGAGHDWVALLPAGIGYAWPFRSADVAKLAVDRELEAFWGS